MDIPEPTVVTAGLRPCFFGIYACAGGKLHRVHVCGAFTLDMVFLFAAGGGERHYPFRRVADQIHVSGGDTTDGEGAVEPAELYFQPPVAAHLRILVQNTAHTGAFVDACDRVDAAFVHHRACVFLFLA